MLHEDDEEGKKYPADVESEAWAAMAIVDIVERKRLLRSELVVETKSENESYTKSAKGSWDMAMSAQALRLELEVC